MRVGYEPVGWGMVSGIYIACQVGGNIVRLQEDYTLSLFVTCPDRRGGHVRRAWSDPVQETDTPGK